jgi:hypothetical protein
VVSGGHLSQFHYPVLHLAPHGLLQDDAARDRGSGGRRRLQLFGAFVKMVLPLSLPAILTVVIFSFALTLQEFVFALTFISSSGQKPVALGVATDLIRGDIYYYYWGELMAGAHRQRAGGESPTTCSSIASLAESPPAR